MSRQGLSLLLMVSSCLAAACEQHQKDRSVPEVAPVVSPAAPAPAAAPTRGEVAAATAAGPDGGATPVAVEDAARFLEFDRANLRKHLALLAFTRKTRKSWDQLAAEVGGARDEKREKSVVARIERLQRSQRAAIAAQARALQPLNEKSAVAGEHDTNLHFLADEYPTAVVSAASGDPGPLQELRAEMDRNEQKISAWLDKLRAPAATAK